MTRRVHRILFITLILSLCGVTKVRAQATKTVVQRQDGKWALLRDGKPYFIKGAGGEKFKPLLAELGGNSIRTWGADHLDATLDEAQKLGLSVTVGIWLGHERQGFDYNDTAKVT